MTEDCNCADGYGIGISSMGSFPIIINDRAPVNESSEEKSIIRSFVSKLKAELWKSPQQMDERIKILNAVDEAVNRMM